MESKIEFSTIILAAGKGTRMKSDRPKVLHSICGNPLIKYPLVAATQAGASNAVIVIGHGSDEVRLTLKDEEVTFAIQAEQLGTGHAVMVCKEAITERTHPVLILCGDAPLITSETISDLVKRHTLEKNNVTVLTADFDDPFGYGRIVKDGDEIIRIVEEKDDTPEEKKIKEVNSGVYCVDATYLFDALANIGRDNAQGEYYLTDIIKAGKDAGVRVGWSKVSDHDEIMGINSRQELAEAGQIMRLRILDELMTSGVTLIDPQSTYVDAGVKVGKDSILYPQVRLEGHTVIGEKVILESGNIIINSKVGNGTHLKPYCVITDSELAEETIIGPFAHLRPGSTVKDKGKVGNFCEMKKSVLGEGSKVNHLSYIGDSEVGKGVNIGAGTVTCNYDGYNKYKTIIEEGVFIGSGTNLVAPVTVGSGAVIGAGSTITRNVPSDSLSLTRPEQKVLKAWAKKRREGREKK